MAGGPLGTGRQIVSWVHLADAVRAILCPLDDARLDGAYVVTAPNPVSQRDLARAIGRALHRPAIVPAPAFALELALGKERAELVLRGQRVLPRRLQALGFAFDFPTIDEALADIFAVR
jgi:NAD dependent epimerase/dehydratase family enzyme